jgi:hypothetical protein
MVRHVMIIYVKVMHLMVRMEGKYMFCQKCGGKASYGKAFPDTEYKG